MPSAAPESGPSRIGKYRIVRHLKSGGMASVYKAEDTESGQVVALKVLSSESVGQPKRIERFRREARQGARLRHENIVSLYEFGEADGTLYLALEFIDGVDVEEMIRLHGPLAPEDARGIVAQVARALDYANRKGVVHRDIKPSNILITQRYGRCVAKLADLGLARGGLEEETRVTADGSTVGTVDYMSPEQAKDSGQADTRSDLYALGCTMYHMLAGMPPFAEGSIIERLMKHAKAEPGDLREINPQIPDDLWAVCCRMLAKKPSQRYQTPAELLTDLAHAAPHAGPAPAGTGRLTKVDGATKIASANAPQATPAKPAVPLAERVRASSDAQPAPEDEGRRIVQAQFEHATHAIATGNFDYGLTLLHNCCRADPGNVVYQQALRQGQLARSATPDLRPWRALPTRLFLKIYLSAAQRLQKHDRVLRCAEHLLSCNPDDLGTQLAMADAARAEGHSDLALWLLETAQMEHPQVDRISHTLAEVLEERGEISRSLELWESIAHDHPGDREAQKKIRDLAASEATGKYYAARKAKKSQRGNSLTR